MSISGNLNVDLFTTSKNLSEFLAVITKFPGNSLTLKNALTVLQDFKTFFTILYPNEKSYKIFLTRLCRNRKEINHKARKVLHKGHKEKLTKKEVFTG